MNKILVKQYSRFDYFAFDKYYAQAYSVCMTIENSQLPSGAGRIFPSQLPIKIKSRNVEISEGKTMTTKSEVKPGKFPRTGEHPKAIMLRCGDWIEAAKDQMFQESERGQAWELWQGRNDGGATFIKRFPKERVLMTSGSKRSVVVSR